jgi:Xaa-Pro aminopeptidase
MTRRSISALFAICIGLAVATGASAQLPSSEYATRRTALLGRLPDAVLLALGAHEPAQDYLSFYQTPSFNYLTGFMEPGAALIMTKSRRSTSATLFVEPREPAREIWVGMRLGVEGATQRTGIRARDMSDFGNVLDSLARTGLPIYVVGDFGSDEIGDHSALTPDQQFVAALRRQHPGLVVKSATGQVEQLRGTKSPGELALIRKAAEITAASEDPAKRALQPGMNENPGAH